MELRTFYRRVLELTKGQKPGKGLGWDQLNKASAPAAQKAIQDAIIMRLLTAVPGITNTEANVYTADEKVLEACERGWSSPLQLKDITNALDTAVTTMRIEAEVEAKSKDELTPEASLRIARIGFPEWRRVAQRHPEWVDKILNPPTNGNNGEKLGRGHPRRSSVDDYDRSRRP